METVIELLRHAKARSREGWWGRPDRERPLTDNGGAQSRGLVGALTDAGPVDGLYSSPWVRCTQTLEPLADHLDLSILDEETLGEVLNLPVHDGGDAWVTSAWLGGRAVGFIDRAVHEHAGQRIVACSHGDVIPAVVALIAGRDGLPITDVACKKAGRFTLTFDGATCVRADHHPPPD